MISIEQAAINLGIVLPRGSGIGFLGAGIMFFKEELNVCDLNTAPTAGLPPRSASSPTPAGRSSPRSWLVNRVRTQFLVRVVCRNPDVGIGHLSLRRPDSPDLKSTARVEVTASNRRQPATDAALEAVVGRLGSRACGFGSAIV
ncbi:hypothetical protein [Mesorhizobium sp. M1403]|uniref:hypothetical protein n=1 Tax=Mesorhizobium sp. M1403 TaxID=2957097 RepID=UPI003334C8D1